MNDPEIIRKLEEIKEELSGIKHEVNWIPKAFSCMVFGTFLGVMVAVGIDKLVKWLF